MALPVLTCQQCCAEVTIPRRWSSKRKFCNICQVTREMATRRPGAKPCAFCGTPFWAIRTSRTWDKCGRCTQRFTMEQRLRSKPCNVCGDQVPPADGMEETCLACIQSTEHYRDAYVLKLNEIVANRAKTFIASRTNPSELVV